MPWSEVGQQRLDAALPGVDEPLPAPLTVWYLDVASGREERGELYGWRAEQGERRGLVVTRYRDGDGFDERAVWVPAELIRRRRE